MQTILHKNDLSEEIEFSDVIAADCEMMGLQPKRDPLCLIQLYDGITIIATTQNTLRVFF